METGRVHTLSGPACIQGARRRTCSTWRHGRGGIRSNIAARRRVQGSGLQAGQACQPCMSCICLVPCCVRECEIHMTSQARFFTLQLSSLRVLLSCYMATWQRLACATNAARSAGKLGKRKEGLWVRRRQAHACRSAYMHHRLVPGPAQEVGLARQQLRALHIVPWPQPLAPSVMPAFAGQPSEHA